MATLKNNEIYRELEFDVEYDKAAWRSTVTNLRGRLNEDRNPWDKYFTKTGTHYLQINNEERAEGYREYERENEGEV